MASGLIVLTGNATYRSIHAREMSSRGFTVVEADDHNEALNRIGSSTPVLFVFMVGIKAGKAAAQQTRERHTGTYPILFVLDDLTLSDMETCLRAGGDDFLIKPTTRDLLDRINVWQRPAKRASLDKQRREALDRVKVMNETGAVETGTISDLDDLLLFDEDDMLDFAQGRRDLPADDRGLDDLLAPAKKVAPKDQRALPKQKAKDPLAGNSRAMDALDDDGDGNFLDDLLGDPAANKAKSKSSEKKVWPSGDHNTAEDGLEQIWS